MQTINQPLHLTYYSLLKISGADAKKLLQGQLTCNLDEINQTENRMGALCNPQGRIISLFYIFQTGNDYLLLMPKNLIAITIETLKKFAVFYKVALTEEPTLYVYGYLNNDVQPRDVISRINFPGKTSRYIAISATPIDAIQDDSQWQHLNIQDGIPEIFQETSGKFLPHEINLPALNAISFDKGCYTGQEIIARMHYRAKLKKHLYQATLTSLQPLVLGETIFTQDEHEPRPSGIIVNVCQHNDHKYHALLIVDDANAEQTTLQFGIH